MKRRASSALCATQANEPSKWPSASTRPATKLWRGTSVPQKPQGRYYLSATAAAPASQITTIGDLDHAEYRPEASRSRIFNPLQRLTIPAESTQFAFNFKLHLDNSTLDVSDHTFAVG
jgi:hypothetical protein